MKRAVLWPLFAKMGGSRDRRSKRGRDMGGGSGQRGAANNVEHDGVEKVIVVLPASSNKRALAMQCPSILANKMDDKGLCVLQALNCLECHKLAVSSLRGAWLSSRAST